jgi:hypothetical protein
MNGNSITNNTVANTGSGTLEFAGFNLGGASSYALDNNTISNIGINVNAASSAVMTVSGIRSLNSSLNETFTNNNINLLYIKGSSTSTALNLVNGILTNSGVSTKNITNNNINTFSNLDKRNDKGLGIKWNINDERKLNATDTNSWKLKTSFDVEQISNNFVYVERYRSSEFERDWNRDFNSDRIFGRQQLGNISLGLFKAEKNISYTYSFFNEQNQTWMDNLISKSILMSGVAEKLRNQFFKAQMKKIDALLEEIEKEEN